MTGILRTPAGAGIALLIVACLIALNVTASPCELPDGTIDQQCEVVP